MERERGGGDDEVEHEVGGEEVREEARREDVAEDLGQIEHGRVWHDRESERPKTMRSARPDRPGAGRAPATSPAPSASPKRNGYLLRYFLPFCVQMGGVGTISAFWARPTFLELGT